ncbi:MAG TPA: hypothetical protein VL400_01775, partial [Polyangiaceae bacterium]|nr:hypothetical protein [Polyangiaceae bacterium]
DQRISELEEELAKAKQQLAAMTPTPVVPRPATPMKTVPMRALSPQPMPAFPAPPAPRAPPLAPRGQGATLFMPATDAPLASPYPSASAAPSTAPTAPPAAPYPSAPPAIAVHSTSPPPELADHDEGGGRTMMLTPEQALLGGASLGGASLGGASLDPVAPVGPAPASQAPPGLGTPSPFANPAHEPTAKTFEQGELVLAPPKKSKAGWLVVPAVLACALAGGAYAYRMGLGPFAELRGTTTSSDDARSTKANPRGAGASTSEASPAATSKSTAAANGGTSATAGASATSAASAGSTAAPAPAPDDPAELAALLSFQGYLTVESTQDAEVVVQGQSAGRTNTRLLVRCGPRNVRLRGPDQAWLSEGEHVQIECMKHTHVTIAAK